VTRPQAGQPGFDYQQMMGGEFFFCHHIHTGSGVHPTFYPMDTGGSFPGGKVAGV